MNVIVQLVVYPIWNGFMGNEKYGNVIFLISVMNIFAISVGISCNYARMTQSSKGETYSTNYIAIMSVASLLAIPYSIIVSIVSGSAMSTLEVILFVILTILTMWRYYSDVEFRINVNYKGYFVFYLIISVGYLIGAFLFKITGLWTLALIVGELSGLIYVGMYGKVLHKDIAFCWGNIKSVIKPIVTLLGSEVISSLIFNGDRVLLKILLDGTAVACFYQASLIGKTMSLISTPLNSVIIGHLVKFKGVLTLKFVNIIFAVSVVLSFLMTAVCTIGSHIIILLFYPDSYETIKNVFIISNLALILYFISNMISVVVLRFSKPFFSLAINVIYAISFCAFCIPLTIFNGFNGFCVGYLITCAMRYVSSLLICYIIVFRKKGEKNDIA